MTRADALPARSTPVTRSFQPLSLAVLIQVPQVRHSGIKPVSTVSSHDRSRVVFRSGKPRRRLKREVRMAGLGLLGLLPMSLAIHVWWMSLDNMAIAGSLPVESVAQGVIAHRSRGFSANPPLSLPVRGLSSTGPRIMLSIEPASVAAGAESESPVVFPGYLLPDDNREEPPHEGS